MTPSDQRSRPVPGSLYKKHAAQVMRVHRACEKQDLREPLQSNAAAHVNHLSAVADT